MKIKVILLIIIFFSNHYPLNRLRSATSSQDAYFDDFRISPLQSIMTTFVYDQFTHELLYTLDKDNFYTRYEYDTAGKLRKTYKEIISPTEKPVGAMKYNYGRDK